MGFIKDLGSFGGKLFGCVVGGTVTIAGEVTKSELIKDVGKGVYQVSSKSGDLLGNLAEGAVDTVVGIISEKHDLTDKGKKQFLNAAGDTVMGSINGFVTIVEKGLDTTQAILDGDKERTIECGKNLLKIAAIGALSIGVIEIFDGIDGVDGDYVQGWFEDMDSDFDSIVDEIDINDNLDYDFDEDNVENPNMHYVEPHIRTLEDGSDIWVDGDGNTSVDSTEGWVQHNPDYTKSNINS